MSLSSIPTKSEILEVVPPHDREAELRCIGSAVRSDKAFHAMRLVPEDFYVEEHAKVWRIFAGLDEKRLPFDHPGAMKAECGVQCVSVAQVAEVLLMATGDQGFTVHPAYYADVVRDRKQRRVIQAALYGLHQRASDEHATVEEILAECEGTLSSVKTGRWTTDPVPLETALLAVQDRIDAILTDGQHLGVPSGFEAFDSEVGGFFPGEVTILAARTNIGKTSLAMQYATYAAERGRRVYVATLEMSATELAMKAACCGSGVNVSAIRTGRITANDQTNLLETINRMSRLPMVLHDWPSIRAYDIRRAARQFKAELIVVDYLTLLTPADHKQKRYEQVGKIMKDLKSVARDLNVPVIALAQLNRETEKQGKESRPKLIHLRECGDIEQDADCVLLLYRVKGKPFQRLEKSDISGKMEAVETWDAELELAKGRLGVNHAVYRLDWDATYSQYYEHGSSRSIAASHPARNDFAAYGGNGNEF